MIPSRSTPNLRDTSSSSITSNVVHNNNNSKSSNTAPNTVYSYLQTLHHETDLNFAPIKISSLSSSSSSSSCRDAADHSPPPTPPVRDSSTLKSVKYGPGHEKFPSWPVPATADTPQALRNHNGGSHRSKSWTDHTNYPKEKVVAYTRPYMKRQQSVYTQQKLKTVMEKCEKIPPETYESRRYDKMNERVVYLPHVNHDGKSLGDMEYVVPSPPERDVPNASSKSELTKADLEAYARSYQDTTTTSHLTESGLEEFMEYTRSYDDSLFSSLNSKHEGSGGSLHQKQISYAQSEGYHSYVSSTDSTSTTPFLDRLRRDSDAVVMLSRPVSSSNTWEDMMSCHDEEEPASNSASSSNLRRTEGGRDSVVTTTSSGAGSAASSSETLKWHGSMSDISSVLSSSSSSHLASAGAGGGGSSSSKQLIVHSARVQTPQRHHSESVLYMTGEKDCDGNWKYRESKHNNANKLKLFPISTYTVQESDSVINNKQQMMLNSSGGNNRLSLSLQSALSVADRINELEKQQKYSYLDPEKKHKIPDPTLKAIQKKALLSFYERHNNPNKNYWRSEPQLLNPQQIMVSASATSSTTSPVIPPKVTNKAQMPSRRASSASDYASGNSSKRSSLASTNENHIHSSTSSKTMPIRHQHSNSCGSLSITNDCLGPMIVGPTISVDDWVPEKPPERPPKNPYLRAAFPDLFQQDHQQHQQHRGMLRSPDLPLPSPPTILDDEVVDNDEPLPPPPPDLDVAKWPPQEFSDISRCGKDESHHQHQQRQMMKAAPQVQRSNSRQMKQLVQTVGLPEQNFRNSYSSSMDSSSSSSMASNSLTNHSHEIAKHHYVPIQPERLATTSTTTTTNPNNKSSSEILGFPNQRGYQERSSTRYPTSNVISRPPAAAVASSSPTIAVSQKVARVSEQYRPEPLLRPSHSSSSSSNNNNRGMAVKTTVPRQQQQQLQQRASLAECTQPITFPTTESPPPPPLKPRQVRVNQSMRVKGSNDYHRGNMALKTSLACSSPGKEMATTRERSSSMSQSKASYLAHRRDRDRIIPDTETGSYKRTMSPNGHALLATSTPSPEESTTQRLDHNMRETSTTTSIWPLNKLTKDARNNNNNKNQNVIVTRRSSMNDNNSKRAKDKFDGKEEMLLRKQQQQLVLPDVLPMNVKLAGPRSQEYNNNNSNKRPSYLSLSPSNNNHSDPDSSAIKTRSSPKSSPPMLSSPPISKHYSRSSPILPSPNASSLSSFVPTSTATTVAVSSAVISTPSVKFSLSVLNSASKATAPAASPPRTPTRTTTTPPRTPPVPSHSSTPRSSSVSTPVDEPFHQRMSPVILPPPRKMSPPAIKPSLSPNCTTKISPIRICPQNISPVSTTSSVSSPLSSPKSPISLNFSTLSTPPVSPETTSPSPASLEIAASKAEVYPKVIEGLKMIQRTEVVVRVNTSTTDASSQTEIEEVSSSSSPSPPVVVTKLQEEIECEKLAEAFIDHLPQADKLKELLVPVPEHKKPSDYVQGLFRINFNMKARPASSPFRSRASTPSCTPPPPSQPNTPLASSNTCRQSISSATQAVTTTTTIEPTSPLSESSIYFTTSEPKVKFLTRFSQDMNEYNVIKSTKDLSQKKDELVSRLGKKLEVLRSEQVLVTDESKINDELGENVELYINRLARPNELAKFRLHVEEVGKITSLLLGLSGRLARAENALMGMADDHPEKGILECKRDKLLDQLEEAKKLKECIDRRSITVSNILYKYLNSEEYADYDHFINMKAKLIMDSKEISDKIKLGEEQLMALKETLIVAD